MPLEERTQIQSLDKEISQKCWACFVFPNKGTCSNHKDSEPRMFLGILQCVHTRLSNQTTKNDSI